MMEDLTYNEQIEVLDLFDGMKKNPPRDIHFSLKKLATKEQRRIFYGKQCSKCGNNERITKYNGGNHDGECFTCKAISNAQRRAREKMAWRFLDETERQQMREIYAERIRKEVETGIDHEVHHIIPFEYGGQHHPNNLIVLTSKQHKKVHKLLSQRRYDNSSTKWNECLNEALDEEI